MGKILNCIHELKIIYKYTAQVLSKNVRTNTKRKLRLTQQFGHIDIVDIRFLYFLCIIFQKMSLQHIKFISKLYLKQ